MKKYSNRNRRSRPSAKIKRCIMSKNNQTLQTEDITKCKVLPEKNSSNRVARLKKASKEFTPLERIRTRTYKNETLSKSEKRHLFCKKCCVRIKRLPINSAKKLLARADEIIRNEQLYTTFSGKNIKKCFIKIKRVPTFVCNNKLNADSDDNTSLSKGPSVSRQSRRQLATIPKEKAKNFTKTAVDIIFSENNQDSLIIQSSKTEVKSEYELILQPNTDINGMSPKSHYHSSENVTKRCRVNISRVPPCVYSNKLKAWANENNSISKSKSTLRQRTLQVAKTKEWKNLAKTTTDIILSQGNQQSLIIRSPEIQVKSEYEPTLQPNNEAKASRGKLYDHLSDNITKRCFIKLKRVCICTYINKFKTRADENNSICQVHPPSQQCRRQVTRTSKGKVTNRKGKGFIKPTADIILAGKRRQSLRMQSSEKEVKSEYELILQSRTHINGVKTRSGKLYDHLSGLQYSCLRLAKGR